ncbi:hypothetical protein CPC08DRAFT_712075 [Agrocybe pediades]|nr:hypothetical protein CPC08DRAFT_712075 [Agrocybe pediades]
MDSTSFSIFPQELFDHVIDEVGKSGQLGNNRAQQLAALALVSRSFRVRAHSHLFKKIELVTKQESRARLLVELLEANSQLASYITSLCLVIRFPDPDSKPALIYIFRALFNEKDNSTPCSLSVRLQRLGISWVLEKDMELALFEICHKPRLVSLLVSDYHLFPRNFLKYAFIKHLSLSKVRGGEPLPEHVFDTVPGRTLCREVVYLESLVHHHSVHAEALRLLDHASDRSTPPRAVFSQLKKLDLSMHPRQSSEKWDGMRDIAVLANGLQELSVDIFTAEYATKPIPLHQLPTLRKLTLRASSLSNNFSHIPASLRQEQLRPTLRDLAVTFNIFFSINTREPTDCKELLRRKLEQMHCPLADHFFAVSNSHHGLQSPVFTLAIRSRYYKQDEEVEYSSIIRAHFPLIVGRADLRFTIIVRELKELDRWTLYARTKRTRRGQERPDFNL